MAYKQTVELGNYELDTWLSWAQLVIKSKDYHSAIEILNQGLEFFPENANIPYTLAGLHLELNNREKGRIYLVNALQINFEERTIFTTSFPQFSNLVWIKNIIEDCNRS